jgi:hypothetical protein
MAARRYTLIEFDDGETAWEVHKPGCKHVGISVADGGVKRLIKVDLEAADEEVLAGIGAYDDMTMADIHLCACTGYETEDPAPTPDPQPAKPVHAAAAASKEAAAERLAAAVETIIVALVAARGVDDVGLGDEWAAQRSPTCTDDYVYDLAVEVRKQRNKGEPWWRVGYELGLPGSGPSNKQGRKGGAFARRLWRAAWGKTYTEDAVVVKRESKVSREARAAANLGRPYFSEEAKEEEIINKITGQMIHWVARLEGRHGLITSAQEAYVHHDPRLVKYRLGPQGPYVEFYEQVDAAQLRVDPRLSIAKSGPLRAVYVDRITRVGV